MKKRFILKSALIVLFSFLVVNCSSEDEIQNSEQNIQTNQYAVNLEEAIDFGNKFGSAENLKENFKGNVKSKGMSSFKDKEIKSIEQIKNTSSKTRYFVINYKDGGFLLLSADRRANPIQAYSFKNSFSLGRARQVEGLNIWIDGVNKFFDELLISDMKQDSGVKKLWDRIDQIGLGLKIEEPDPNDCEDEVTTVGPLLSTEWHQGSSFNANMPIINCGSPIRALAGCVPIAIAQTMKYFEHPTTYQWSNMPNTTATVDTSDMIEDIHDGINSTHQISYLCGATGVGPDYRTDLLLENTFNYTNASYGNYNKNTVESNIGQGKVVILQGIDASINSGHMWVADGYRRTGICIFDSYGNWVSTVYYLDFHMNWGWGGDEDGFYSFSNFNPYNYSFNDQVKMIYNINP